jgi:hypothetical protein
MLVRRDAFDLRVYVVDGIGGLDLQSGSLATLGFPHGDGGRNERLILLDVVVKNPNVEKGVARWAADRISASRFYRVKTMRRGLLQKPDDGDGISGQGKIFRGT